MDEQCRLSPLPICTVKNLKLDIFTDNFKPKRMMPPPKATGLDRVSRVVFQVSYHNSRLHLQILHM